VNRPVSVAGVAFFRVAFGTILFAEVVRYFANNWVQETFIAPGFHFTYRGFEWVRPWPGAGMNLHFAALGILAALIAAGAYYRVATVLFFLGFTYVFLLEKAVYLNHLYLVCLLSFLLMFLPLERAWSWDAWRARRGGGSGRLPNNVPPGRRDVPERPSLQDSEQISTLVLWALRAQIAIPYVYGALAKLNGDWLRGQPMQIWMSRMEGARVWIPAFGEPWLAVLISWGGFLFDLLVVPLLLWKRTRPFAFAAAVLFHVANALMWDIGIFPWFMICATTLFLEPDWPRRLLRYVGRPSQAVVEKTAWEGRPTKEPALERHPTSTWQNYALATVLGVFFAVQFLCPLRHYLYPGHVDWTEEGSQFAWRMMLNDKAAVLQITFIDPATGRRMPFDPRHYLTRRQIDKMSHDPEMLREFANYVKAQLKDTELEGYEVRALVLCSLNGRKPQLLIDPTVDLGAKPRTLWPKPWIVPLTEPLPEEPWLVPQSEWIKHVDLRPPQQP
jgi:vitamin K-dependent gamma-carboxylase